MGGVVHSLYKNKLYAACRDTVTKSEGVIAIASAYQSFLWSNQNSEKIKGLDDIDTRCGTKLNDALGIKQLLEIERTVLDLLVTSLNNCWSGFPAQADDLLDLSTVLHASNVNLDDVLFNHDTNDNVRKFLILSWFITSVFGIKTKSKPSKILALGRTYLKLFVGEYNRETVPVGIDNILFNCNFRIQRQLQPQQIVPENAPDEGSVQGYFPCTDYRILCLAYSSFNIENAIQKYREIQDGYNLPQETARGQTVIRKIIRDEQGNRNSAQILGIMYGSSVFQNEILKQLLIRFSILPRGKEFTITSSANMRFLIMKLYQFITGIPVEILDIESFSTLCKNFVDHIFTDVQALNIYTPSKHDTSKFENFPRINANCTYQYFRTKWIIYLVRGMINSLSEPSGDYNYVYTCMKLFILLIKYLINVDEIDNLERYIPTILRPDAISSSSVSARTGSFLSIPPVRLSRELLVNVNMLIQSEYPETQAACISVSQTIIERNKGEGRGKGVSKTKFVAGILTNLGANPEKPQDGGTIRTRNPNSPKKTNNHTRKNKYKRNNKNKKHKSSPKYRKVVPSSRSGSQSNRKKSKSKLTHKNVTFKRRRARK